MVITLGSIIALKVEQFNVRIHYVTSALNNIFKRYHTYYQIPD